MATELPVMSWVHDRARLQTLAQRVDPSVRLYTKDNWFAKVMAVFVTVFTFGGISYRTFLEDFATTIGPLQFYPAAWRPETVERVCIHEGRHTRQARWLGLFIHPWLGLPLFGLLYLLLPLPLGLAYFRALFERDALKYELRHLKTGGASNTSLVQRAEEFGRTVCSGNYGWALPASIGVPWFISAAKQVTAEFR